MNHHVQKGLWIPCSLYCLILRIWRVICNSELLRNCNRIRIQIKKQILRKLFLWRFKSKDQLPLLIKSRWKNLMEIMHKLYLILLIWANQFWLLLRVIKKCRNENLIYYYSLGLRPYWPTLSLIIMKYNSLGKSNLLVKVIWPPLRSHTIE